METFFYPDPLIRLPLYVCLGLVNEIIFTGVADLVNPSYLQSWRLKDSNPGITPPLKRNPNAMGYTFLWMIPLYTLLVFLEPLYQLTHNLPWFIRGLIYVPVFFAGEYFTGALIKKIIGFCPWDYSNSRYSLHSYIRWDFAPFWFVFTLGLEQLSLKFVQLTPAIRAIL